MIALFRHVGAGLGWLQDGGVCWTQRQHPHSPLPSDQPPAVLGMELQSGSQRPHPAGASGRLPPRHAVPRSHGGPPVLLCHLSAIANIQSHAACWCNACSPFHQADMSRHHWVGRECVMLPDEWLSRRTAWRICSWIHSVWTSPDRRAEPACAQPSSAKPRCILHPNARVCRCIYR